MANAADLQSRFGIPNVLSFQQSPNGLVVLHVTAPTAEATVHLQGAHVTHWKPTGFAPASMMEETKAANPGADQPVSEDNSVWTKSRP